MDIAGVTESAIKYLRVHIITGKIAPGTKLIETEIAENLGISRPPLREAFRILENEHLILYTPRKGCYVTEVSVSDCREIYEAREMIECFSVDLLKSKGIRELPEITSALAEVADLPIPTHSNAHEKFNYLEAIDKFHIKLVESTGNTRMKRFYHTITSSLARYQSIYAWTPELLKKSQSDHATFFELIRAGEYDQAKQLLSVHIKYFIRLIEDRIQK